MPENVNLENGTVGETLIIQFYVLVKYVPIM